MEIIGKSKSGNYIVRNTISFENTKNLQHIENFINDIIDCKGNYIWFEDDKGQRFVPNGKIHIGLVSGLSYESD